MAKDDVTVCLYHDGLAGPLTTFAKRVWPADAISTPKEDIAGQALTGRGKVNGHKSPTFLFLKDEEVIGHITTLPVRLNCNSRLTRGYWVVGFMVLPQYRNGPIGPLLIKKVNQTLALTMTLHVEDTVLRIFKGLGWHHLGVIPQYVLVLKAFRLLSSVRLSQMGFLRKYGLCGPSRMARIVSQRLPCLLLALLCTSASRALSFGTALLKPARASGAVTEEEEFDPGYDALWEKVGGKFDALVVRDRTYLEARYGRPIKNYRLLAHRHEGALLAYCILKVKQFNDDSRMGSAKVGSIIDCLFDPEDPRGLHALLTAAVDLFKREQVDVIVCTASHFKVQRLLWLNGFVKVPGSLNFAYHDKADSIRAGLGLASWHLMRGDSDADGNF